MSATVVIQTAFLGDLLLSVPLLVEIKKTWPQDKIILVCRKNFADLMKSYAVADEVYGIKKGDRKTYQEALQSINSNQVNRIICPHESPRTAILCAQIKSPNKVSYAQFWNGIFFNHRIEKVVKMPDALRQLKLLTPFREDLQKYFTELSVNQLLQKDSHHKLTSSPDWGYVNLKSWASHNSSLTNQIKLKWKLSPESLEKTVLLFPGSVWATKRWTIEGFIDVAKILILSGYQVRAVGGPGEEIFCQQICNAVPEVVNDGGTLDLPETSWLIAHSSLVIGNDSGPSHMSCLMGTKTLTILGPTDVSFGYRPWGPQAYIAEQTGLACRPCGSHGHQKCPVKTHACMKSLSGEYVAMIALSILQNKFSH